VNANPAIMRTTSVRAPPASGRPIGQQPAAEIGEESVRAGYGAGLVPSQARARANPLADPCRDHAATAPVLSSAPRDGSAGPAGLSSG